MKEKIAIPPEDLRAASKPIVVKRSKFNPIWILPLLAAVLGGWLIYKSIVDAKIPITIYFDSGVGIDAGKTKVVYKGISIGVVERISMKPDLSGVAVVVEFDKRTKPYLNTGTQFWLVSPSVSLTKVSGLETIVSGRYISMRPGEGKAAKEFVALKTPPALPESAPVLQIQLRAKELGSISPGSEIYYRKIPVGEVLNYDLADNGEDVMIKLYIHEQFSHLVRKNSRFWNASSIDISRDVSGIKVRTQSVTSIMASGIAFNTPENEKDEGPAAQNDIYSLHESFDEAQTGIMATIDFNSGDGLVENQTKVIFEGFTAGVVKKVTARLEDDRFVGVTAHIMFDPRAERVLVDNTQFWMVKPRVSVRGVDGIDTLLKGNYIDMQVDDYKNANPVRHFVALDGPPSLPMSAPGLHIKLVLNDLGSISPGTAIYYKRIPVGQVQTYKYEKNGDKVLVDMHIDENYAHLVKKSTRFYDVSGLMVNGGLEGINLKVESMEALLSGGISFYTPPSSKTARSENGDKFTLYDSLEAAAETGFPIKIQFAVGDGLKADSTVVKYKGMTIGRVKDIKLKQDLSGVTARVLLDEPARVFAKQDSLFWVVRPKVGLDDVSGLDTVVSGPYIEVNPGSGPETTVFQGLEGPPFINPNEPGLRVVLKASQLGSLKEGSPVYYRQVNVGKVEGYSLEQAQNGVLISLFIPQEFSSLVQQNSKFWNISGVEVKADISGVKIKTESFTSMLNGGIAFETPFNPEGAKPSHNGDIFPLYDGYEQIYQAEEQSGKVYIKLAADQLGSLSKGKPVFYRQIQVGEIDSYQLANTADRVLFVATIDKRYAPLIRKNTKFWNVSGFGMDFSLFGGKLKTSTVDSLIKGGVAFSTPDNKDMGEAPGDDTVFEIYNEPKEQWLKWQPKIQL